MKVEILVLCSFFAALTGVCSMVSVPLPFTPVQINLATFAVFLSGGLLGKKYGSISQIVYILIGLAGAPVFQGFTSGAASLVGPTGGYLIGYVTAAFLTGLITEKASFKGRFIVGCSVGMISCYLLGTARFVMLTGVPVWAALGYCVFPFIPGDAIKIAAASTIIKRLAHARILVRD